MSLLQTPFKCSTARCPMLPTDTLNLSHNVKFHQHIVGFRQSTMWISTKYLCNILPSFGLSRGAYDVTFSLSTWPFRSDRNTNTSASPSRKQSITLKLATKGLTANIDSWPWNAPGNCLFGGTNTGVRKNSILWSCVRFSPSRSTFRHSPLPAVQWKTIQESERREVIAKYRFSLYFSSYLKFGSEQSSEPNNWKPYMQSKFSLLSKRIFSRSVVQHRSTFQHYLMPQFPKMDKPHAPLNMWNL